MTTPYPTYPNIPDGSVVEWMEHPTHPTAGPQFELPAERQIGRVNHMRVDGIHLVVIDPDGVRRVLHRGVVTVIAERAEAGWANLR